MKIYILRYSSEEGDTSHVNEAFRSKAAANKRFNELKKDAEYKLENMEAGDTYPIEDFSFGLDHYLRKWVINNVDDLIRMVNNI